MQIPWTEDLAVILMCELAAEYGGRPVSLTDISGRHGVSRLYLKKIARKLRITGLISSREGANGGYYLTAAPDTISVWDVLNSGIRPLRKQRNPDCPLIAVCLPQRVRSKLSLTLERSLSAVKLSDLLG
ncbi:hypothetical protein A2Z33_02455 [Candidatus Gottesmanbacteria bacterium RBG_16_52_11]|uniref:Rrf2 family transcriptional regulator n=1 Tax=Candidatus Gottesmanbacteria bacterium RBG_16_52_11 TaxID=1798374 RepID=A0A1F5YMP9_9BACT|nr:MAG: hypothetical protein A2Z33_02455 [Candidatus Gottesmanbacteria bacterium RBG_16_52_11]